MYFLVVAGVLTYFSTQTPNSAILMFRILMGFLFLLALMGLAICFKLTKVHNAYIEALERVLVDALRTDRENLRGYLGYRLIKSPKGILGFSVESVSFIYKALYAVSGFMWLFLLFSSFLGLLT